MPMRGLPLPNTEQRLKPLPPLPVPSAPRGVNTAPPGRPTGPSSPTAPGTVGSALLPQMPAPIQPAVSPAAPPPSPLSPAPSGAGPAEKPDVDTLTGGPQSAGGYPWTDVAAPSANAGGYPWTNVAGDPWTDHGVAGDPWTDNGVAGDPWTDNGVAGDPWTDTLAQPAMPVPPPVQLSYIPSSAEVDSLGPGVQITTPWGPVVPGPDGRPAVQMTPEGKQAYGASMAQAEARFGPVPFASTPGLPKPPVVVGKPNFNPWLNLWS